VVEDDAGSAKLAALLLTRAGADVRIVINASAALVALAAPLPDLIVLDLVLPDTSGFTLARALKQDPRTRGVVIVAVSALNNPSTQEAALEAGCVAYLHKPIDSETFAATIATYLGKNP
jgi:two-component system cell cycle response regulator